jgi:hypothetical protein
VTATVAAPSTVHCRRSSGPSLVIAIPYTYYLWGIGCDPGYVHAHPAPHSWDDICPGGRDHPSFPPDLCNFRGLVVADARRHPAMTDARCVCRLGRRLALFQASQEARQYFEDNLRTSLYGVP